MDNALLYVVRVSDIIVSDSQWYKIIVFTKDDSKRRFVYLLYIYITKKMNLKLNNSFRPNLQNLNVYKKLCLYKFFWCFGTVYTIYNLTCFKLSILNHTNYILYIFNYKLILVNYVKIWTLSTYPYKRNRGYRTLIFLNCY